MAMTSRPRRPSRAPFPTPSEPPLSWASWRHVAAYVYLVICIFDFVAMPVLYELRNPHTSDAETIRLALKVDPLAQVQTIQILKNERTWSPLTTAGNGVFHVSFGAILGAAAFTRGREKVEHIRRGDGRFEQFEEEPRSKCVTEA